MRQEDTIESQIAVDFGGASGKSWAWRRGRCRWARRSAWPDAMRGACHRANGVNRYLWRSPREKDVAQAYVDHCVAILDLGERKPGDPWRSSPILEDEGAGAGPTVASVVLIGNREDSRYHFRARRERRQPWRWRKGREQGRKHGR